MTTAEEGGVSRNCGTKTEGLTASEVLVVPLRVRLLAKQAALAGDSAPVAPVVVLGEEAKGPGTEVQATLARARLLARLRQLARCARRSGQSTHLPVLRESDLARGRGLLALTRRCGGVAGLELLAGLLFSSSGGARTTGGYARTLGARRDGDSSEGGLGCAAADRAGRGVDAGTQECAGRTRGRRRGARRRRRHPGGYGDVLLHTVDRRRRLTPANAAGHCQ